MAAPSAANVYVTTRKLGGDAELGSGIVVAGKVLSVFTVTAWVFLLRTLHVLSG